MSEATPLNLRIAISSSALFDLSDADQVFRERAWPRMAGIKEHGERDPSTRACFPVSKEVARIKHPGRHRRRGSAFVSQFCGYWFVCVFNSIQAHELPIIRAAFTGGGAPYRYMLPFQCQLFLSTNPIDVTDALDHGVAAATVLVSRKPSNPDGPVKFAFDGDAVLFPMKLNRFIRERA